VSSLAPSKKRSDIHPLRNLWHVSGVLLLFGGYYFLPFELAQKLIVIVWSIAVFLDLLRQKNERAQAIVLASFGPLMRDEEIEGLAGTSFLLTGVMLSVILFPREIVLVVLLLLAFADPIASQIGIRYGKIKILGSKSLEGTAAAFSMCFLINLLFLTAHWSLVLPLLLGLSFIGALIGALSELISFKYLDDNLSFPLLSGSGLWVLWQIFGLLP
jgi:diacylglycerol kinase (CTP)